MIDYIYVRIYVPTFSICTEFRSVVIFSRCRLSEVAQQVMYRTRTSADLDYDL
jgi:hypothetical protein